MYVEFPFDVHILVNKRTNTGLKGAPLASGVRHVPMMLPQRLWCDEDGPNSTAGWPRTTPIWWFGRKAVVLTTGLNIYGKQTTELVLFLVAMVSIS